MTSGVMFVTESMEKAGAKPLGPASFILQRILDRRGWKREEFGFAALADFDQEFECLKPRVVVGLDASTLEQLCGLNAREMGIRKDFFKSVHGYAFRELQDRCWVVPSFHPAYLLRGQQYLAQVLMWDIEKARRMAVEGYTYDAPRCLSDPSLPEWEAYVRDALRHLQSGQGVLAADIENPYKKNLSEDEIEMGDYESAIDRISFCFEHGRGVSVLWQMPYLVGIQQLLRAATEKQNMLTFWNRAHDRPRIQRNLGISLPIERVPDGMLAWHVLYSNLDKGLGFVTSCAPMQRSYGLKMWKHLSQSEPEYYSCVDAISLWRNYHDVMERLDQTGQRGVYELRIQACAPITEFMSQQGLGVNLAFRETFKEEVSTKLKAVAQSIDTAVPEAVKGERQWRSLAAAEKGFAKLVEKGEAEGRFEDEVYQVPGAKLEQTCQNCGAHPVVKTHVTKKTVTPDEAIGREPGIAVMAQRKAEHAIYLAKMAEFKTSGDDNDLPF